MDVSANLPPVNPLFNQASAAPLGRLVLILERELHPKSRQRLHGLLQHMARLPEPTFVASLAQPAFLGAVRTDSRGVFYNADGRAQDFSETLGLLPWREVWVVCGGQVWHGRPSL